MPKPHKQPVSELALQFALAQIQPPQFEHPATSQEETFARLLPTHAPEKAYREAGYPCPNSAHKTTVLALQLAAQPQVVERTRYQRQLLEAKYDLRTERIYAEYAAIAFSDPADYLDGNGAILPMDQIRPRARAGIKEMETTVHPSGRTVTKLKLHDKGSALDSLARIKGLFEKDNAQQARVYIDVKRKAEIYDGETEGGEPPVPQSLQQPLQQPSDTSDIPDTPTPRRFVGLRVTRS